MKNQVDYARRANQKLACAEVLLSLSSADADRFVVQSLVEASYLQMELALGFYTAEVLVRYGADTIPSRGDAIELDRLVDYLRHPAPEMLEMNEFKVLLADPDSWFCHCIAMCQSLRQVAHHNARMKSSIFDVAEGIASKDNNLIAATKTATVNIDETLSSSVARGTLQHIKAFIERNRAAAMEY